TTHLADPCRRQVELLAQIQRPFVASHSTDHAALSTRQSLKPSGEVDPELHLIQNWCDRVVPQPLLKVVAQFLTLRRRIQMVEAGTSKTGQRLDLEALMALRDRIHYVCRFRHSDKTTTTVDRSGKKGGEGHQEIGGILSLLVETKEPLPGKRAHFLD